MKFQIEAGKMIGYELEDNEYLINGYELTIPDGVTSIECILPYGIRTLNIPSAVISIDPMAFSSCNTITTVNISDPQSIPEKELMASFITICEEIMTVRTDSL